MTGWIHRALSRRTVRALRGKKVVVVESPNQKLVYAVKFAISIILCLSGLEVASMALIHTWNSEVFAAVSGLIGTVTGIIVGQKA